MVARNGIEVIRTMVIPKISIVTVGMNHLKYLKDLLPSVVAKDSIASTSQNIADEVEMIYVDNCSSDGSVEYIRKNYPQVTIIQNQQPLGFGENNNKGVLAAHGEYIAIINPDIVIKDDALWQMLKYAGEHENVGIIVPQLLNPDGTLQRSVRRYINLKFLVSRGLTKGSDNANDNSVNHYLCKDIDLSRIQEVDWAIGAAMFMKRELYAELGGFDTDYFLYMEDEDICLRSWKLKRPVVYLPTAKMTHNHLRASSKIGKKMFIHMCSMMTFFKKHGFSPSR